RKSHFKDEYGLNWPFCDDYHLAQGRANQR
ncbi:MAG: hypothetical protein ACI97A_004359, partial [Planctomycetota bacterium]